jgi:hypothetical protein
VKSLPIGAKLTVVDPFSGYSSNYDAFKPCDEWVFEQFSRVVDWTKTYRPDVEFTVVKKKFSECDGLFAARSFDTVFIDGDHSFASVCHDFRRSVDLACYGGRVLGHDYCDRTDKDVVLAVKEVTGERYYVIPDTSIWVFDVGADGGSFLNAKMTGSGTFSGG